MPPRRRRVSWLERPVAMAPMEGTSDGAHLSPVHAKSAGCSPMFSRRLRFLGCAGPSFDSPYQLGELAEVHEIVAGKLEISEFFKIRDSAVLEKSLIVYSILLTLLPNGPI
ncbi:unnamed protein product [Haemonchus placei]|uniref:Uncharacterized protein n=1 Tax=Haemonchus placei TaxID=6290 RepID=A0A0N4WGP5_HAEPC|nr:unnamed protein product [Haemonchus placei]